MWSKRAHRTVLAIASAATLTLAASSASADIIFDSSITALGQGFGAVPRLLTVQFTGKAPKSPAVAIESACNGNNAGSLDTTDCSASDAAFQGNGLVNTGGSEVNGPKNALVNLASEGINSANDIEIIYNPSQTGVSPSTDILDLTLKFYNSANVLIFSIDGGCGTTCAFDNTDPLFFADTGTNLGNGGTGFGLVIDSTQQLALDNACGLNFINCTTMSAETTIWNANDGPDSFFLFNLNGVESCTPGVDCPAVPEPITLSLFGAGLAGAGAFYRRRKKTA